MRTVPGRDRITRYHGTRGQIHHRNLAIGTMAARGLPTANPLARMRPTVFNPAVNRPRYSDSVNDFGNVILPPQNLFQHQSEIRAVHWETPEYVRMNGVESTEDKNGNTHIYNPKMMFGSGASLRNSPVSLNLGKHFSRRRQLKSRHGRPNDVTRGRNPHVLRQRISISSGTGRKIHISHISRHDGQSKIFIHTSFGDRKKYPLNVKAPVRGSHWNTTSSQLDRTVEQPSSQETNLNKIDIPPNQNSIGTNKPDVSEAKTKESNETNISHLDASNLTKASENISTNQTPDNSSSTPKGILTKQTQVGEAVSGIQEVNIGNSGKQIMRQKDQQHESLGITEDPDLPDDPDVPDAQDGSDA